MSKETTDSKKNSEKELTPEEKQKQKLDTLIKTLGIDRINQDVSDLRTTVENTNQAVVELVQTIKAAQTPQAQSTENNSESSMNLGDLPHEQKMLLLKDTMLGVADLIKAWKGTATPAQAQGDYGQTIMSSLARAFQVHVDDIVYGTLTRLPPEARAQYTPQGYVPQPPAQPPIQPQRAGFDKG